ncbi:MAG: response regulator, partial [Chryseobacterium sp.]|nr:response regulator [Chryseobacterium sp.]
MTHPASKKYNCIIVEDEPIAAEILENFVSKDEQFHLLAKCSDAVYAGNVLNRHEIDLMFLDLHLPVVKGFDFLKKLKNPPLVIVTTAYHQYAVEGYELDIVDYLMKPIPYDRFTKAVEKFKYLMNAEEALLEAADREHIFISSGKKQIKIVLHDIFYIESL